MNLLKPHAVIPHNTRIIVLVAWGICFFLYWQEGASSVIPKPTEILSSSVELWKQGNLPYALWVSFNTNSQALCLTATFTLFFSYLTVLPATRDITTVISSFRFLSMTGLVIAFTLFFSGGRSLKVALLTFGMTVFSVTQLREEIEAIPKEILDDARTLRLGDWGVVWEVIVLGKMDVALTILRQNAAMGWAMLTMVEGIVRSEGGIGALLLDERKHFNYSAVFAIQLAVLTVGLCQDFGIARMIQLLCPYAFLNQEKK